MDTHQTPTRARARRLAPDERRAALLTAATELFVAHGSAFTTADLAEAAGVSEGTIFRYFPDKASLIVAARDCALGLESLVPELAAAAEHGTVEERLVAAGDVLSAKLAQMARVMEDVEPHEHSHEPPDADLMAAVQAALLPLFGDVPEGAPGNREQLANVFMGMLFSNTLLSLKTGTVPMEVAQLVRLFVHGMSAP